jgi:hypothetical protein
VILQGVAARIGRGQASSAKAAFYAKMTVPTANLAWGMIHYLARI